MTLFALSFASRSFYFRTPCHGLKILMTFSALFVRKSVISESPYPELKIFMTLFLLIRLICLDDGDDDDDDDDDG